MNIFISILATVGIIFLLFSVILPVVEALYFGVVYTWITIEWPTVRRKHIWYCIKFAILAAWARLFGNLAYCDRVRSGNWEYKTPFILYRIK